jgi:glucan phosphoethanolaminetransferase (alkaline phosphatase superfamily)
MTNHPEQAYPAGVPADADFDVQRRLFLFRIVCAAIWAGELFWIQGLGFEVIPWIKYPVLVQLFRFGLNFVFCSALVFLTPRRFLTPLLAVNSALMIAISAYIASFHWPLMPMRLLSELREGWSMHSQAYHFISWPVAGLILFLFALKFFLLWKSGRHTLPFSTRWRLLVLAMLVYGLPVAALQFTNLRLAMGPNGGPGRTVFAYGYTIPWLCDLIANHSIEAHVARAKAYQNRHYDRLTPFETALPVSDRIVVLQLESVGGAAIQAVYQGEPVMPFLHQLKDQSMYYRIAAFHRNGSCDMDYAATTGVEPYPGVVPYRLPGMEYTNSVPAFMSHHGYQTYLFHGNTGLFYERGPVMDRLGFDHIFFKEQLAPQHLPSSLIGVRDADILQCLLKAVQSEPRVYAFCITLDTHAPYLQLTPGEMEVFPDPHAPVERYFNSLRYLDRCLRDFVNQLPEGTTVVLYGDHTASMHTEIFNSDIVDGKEYVGCLIYQKGRDLSAWQQTRQLLVATDGALNLLDVMNYLRHSIAVGAGSVPPIPVVSATR